MVKLDYLNIGKVKQKPECTFVFRIQIMMGLTLLSGNGMEDSISIV